MPRSSKLDVGMVRFWPCLKCGAKKTTIKAKDQNSNSFDWVVCSGQNCDFSMSWADYRKQWIANRAKT